MYLFQRLEDCVHPVSSVITEIEYLIKNKKYQGKQIGIISLRELFEILSNHLLNNRVTLDSENNSIKIQIEGEIYAISEKDLRKFA